MAIEKQSKGALIALGIVVILGSLWWGYRQWQHHKLVTALHDPDPVVRMAAVRSAGKAAHADLLLEALKDEDPDIRFVAVQSLRGVGADNAKKIHMLLEVLKGDDRPGVRRGALDTLRHVSPAARPFIYKALEDSHPRVRASAAIALALPDSMGDPRRPLGEREAITPLLKRLLEDEDEEVRSNAAVVLQELDWERGT
jgi:HEAT repeat protein